MITLPLILAAALTVPTSLELFQTFHGPAPARLSEGNYEAAQETTRRASIRVNVKSEDRVLGTSDRAKLISAARDLRRNSAIVGWVIRRHLDFVSRFAFQVKSGIDQFDDTVEKLVEEWSQPAHCDAAGRHSLPALIRLGEGHAAIDGDILHVRLQSGHLQLITGPRIKNPSDARNTAGRIWKHGVLCDRSNRALAYAVWSEGEHGALEFERTVPAANAVMHGCYDSVDQVRGIGGLAAGVNLFRDSHTNIDLALARAKLANYFALKTTTQPNPNADLDTIGAATVTEIDDDADGTPDREQVTIDFGAGPVTLNLDPGEDAEFMESNHPSSEFLNFHNAVIQIALLSVDLPETFLWPSRTNWIGQQTALQIYKQAAACKQDANRRLINSHTRWRLGKYVLDGRLVLPAGMTVEAIPLSWISRGVPFYIDPAKETRGSLLQIQAGLTTPQRVALERGEDWYDNIDQLAEALAYAREKLGPYDFRLTFDPPQEGVTVAEVSDA